MMLEFSNQKHSLFPIKHFTDFADPRTAAKHDGGCLWEELATISSCWSVWNNWPYRLPVRLDLTIIWWELHEQKCSLILKILALLTLLYLFFQSPHCALWRSRRPCTAKFKSKTRCISFMWKSYRKFKNRRATSSFSLENRCKWFYLCCNPSKAFSKSILMITFEIRVLVLILNLS